MTKIKKRHIKDSVENKQSNKKTQIRNKHQSKLKNERQSYMNISNKINTHKKATLTSSFKHSKKYQSVKFHNGSKCKIEMPQNITQHFKQPDNEIFDEQNSPETKSFVNRVLKKKQKKMKDYSQQSKSEISEKVPKKKLRQERITSLANSGKPFPKNENNLKSSKTHKLNIKRLETMLAIKTEEEKSFKKSKEPESLKERMMKKLRASRFRYLNETLYNNNSMQSKKYFKEDPDAFVAYHNGYKQQVAQWPLNPLDIIIASIKKLPKEHVIADFGCGEALLAASVIQQVHSFDLIALNDRVKACDISHTPLLTNSVNVVIFCLSLMGTNLNDYIIEANRVLKKGGILKIAEVESRFDHVDEFIKLLNNYGFINTWKDLSHNLFYFLDFKKEKDITGNRNKLPAIMLKPCLYKKR